MCECVCVTCEFVCVSVTVLRGWMCKSVVFLLQHVCVCVTDTESVCRSLSLCVCVCDSDYTIISTV